MNYDNFTKEQIVSILQDTLEYLSNLREEIKGLKKEIELYEDNQIHLINQLDQKDNIIDEVLEYLDISNMSFVDKNEIAIRLNGSDKE